MTKFTKSMDIKFMLEFSLDVQTDEPLPDVTPEVMAKAFKYTETQRNAYTAALGETVIMVLKGELPYVLPFKVLN